MEMQDPLLILAKLASAVVLGGLIGWQREARDRPAGLRTHVLVCVGSAVYTLASLSFAGPSSDPGRVAAQVATGMGFSIDTGQWRYADGGIAAARAHGAR